ncbi:hypothetical protein FISHEDRAFT_46453 [Fistulina hepatica ATCC 64428]|uniref:DUF6699 domain-containing protein n=1 Tax=Fistulina hepatica ATCC 64428 TaxID=1128425 RepID=A0A0D7A7W1_9AGAR|nr:hypothetical protein FISHEDRAFT_46453 [Fistulina hepatica ATCC 64428]
MKLFWGPLVIEERRTLSVLDILKGIYEYLQVPLTDSEVEWIRQTRPNSMNIDRVKEERIRLIGFSENIGRYRRIDVLGGSRRFQGMRAMMFQDGAWHLRFSIIDASR